MSEAIDKQVAALVEQLDDPSLTASEIEIIERKLDVLNRLQS